jgi:hypothetical protein
VGGILEGSRTSSPFKKVLAPFQWIYTRFGGRVRHEDEEIYKAYKRFSDCVEWRVKQNWIDYDDVKFNADAPSGHLPRSKTLKTAKTLRLFSRVETCHRT